MPAANRHQTLRDADATILGYRAPICSRYDRVSTMHVADEIEAVDTRNFLAAEDGFLGRWSFLQQTLKLPLLFKHSIQLLSVHFVARVEINGLGHSGAEDAPPYPMTILVRIPAN